MERKHYNIICKCDSNAKTFLLENEVNISRILELAIERDFSVVQFLVSNINISSYIDDAAAFASRKELSGLFYSRIQKPVITPFLIENKADVTVYDNIIIKRASTYNDVNFLKFLVEHKADINCDEGRPIKLAAKIGNLENLKFLLENGGVLNEELSEDLSVIAIENRDIECLEYLISKGVVPNPVHMDDELKIILAERKYFPKFFRKWRKIVFKSFIEKVVTPLYYSPGFPGYIKAKGHFQSLI